MKRLRPPHQDSLPTRAALYADFFNEIGALPPWRSMPRKSGSGRSVRLEIDRNEFAHSPCGRAITGQTNSV